MDNLACDGDQDLISYAKGCGMGIKKKQVLYFGEKKKGLSDTAFL